MWMGLLSVTAAFPFESASASCVYRSERGGDIDVAQLAC